MTDQDYKKNNSSQYEVREVLGMMTNLDPELQNILIDYEAGLTDGMDEVNVTAILTDQQSTVPEFKKVQQMGRVVTGTVKVADIANVRPSVFSLKSAHKIYNCLRDSVPEIRASQGQLNADLPSSVLPVNGSGVIVGVVDQGCDFVHRNFRNEDGTTRLLYLWDQNQESNSPPSEDYPYGKEFDSKAINEALNPPDASDMLTAYQRLGYEIGDDAHGTHVLDIAAGNGQATQNPGIAPQADLIFVELKRDQATQQESMGNSRYLLEAVKYIFDKADELQRSAVVNVSQSTNSGPHDGSTPVEQGFDELLRSSGRAIVISAGNTWTQGGHARGVIRHDQPRVLRWMIEEGDDTDNRMEIWYGGTTRLEVNLITPEGEELKPIALGETSRIFRQQTEVARVFHRHQDPNNNDNQILILFFDDIPAGTWGISLSSPDEQDVTFDAWIEIDAHEQSFFAPEDVDRAFTIGSIACGLSTITVGSYAATAIERDLAEDTAQGPTRDAKHKPEVSAPGVDVRAARSLTQSAHRDSGTSAAAAHVSGLIALLMQASPTRLNIKQIRDAIIESARKNPPPSLTWDSRYGYGRIDATASILTQLSPATLQPAIPGPTINAGSAAKDIGLQPLTNQ